MLENVRKVQRIEARENDIHVYLSQGIGAGTYSLLEKAPYEEEHRRGFEVTLTAILSDQLVFNRFVNGSDRLYSRFYVYEENGMGERRILEGPCCVTHCDGIAKWEYAYPQAPTIKGLQVKVLDDGLKLGIGHAALNINLPCILQARDNGDAIAFRTGGRDFYFNRSYMQAMDVKIKALSEKGVVVNLIILNRREWHGSWGDPALEPILMHPGLHPDGVVSAFHVTSREPLAYYTACLEFLSDRYMRPDELYGRACGLIVGNEVNSQWIYSNAGEMDMPCFIREYVIALRTAFYAARKYYAGARVYVSLDHCWNMANGDNPRRFYKGHDFISALNQIVRAQGDFDWGIAYHPFPEDLGRADFWNDETAWSSPDTGKITFKNVEVLPAFFTRDPFLYRGRRRRIILSEQGLCSGHTSESETLQADAYVLAYRKIAGIPEIDAFIYHSHIDEKQEGLYLGLLAEDGRQKAIYACFVEVDGPRGEELYRAARERIGEECCRSIRL